MDAAFLLFNQKGFHETTMAEIAVAAGIAKGTVYLYFPSKEQLYAEMTKREFGRFLDELKQKLAAAADPEERLRATGRQHLAYFFRLREYKRLLMEVPNNDPEIWRTLVDMFRNYIAIVADALAADGGEHSPLAARAFVGMLDGFAREILFDHSLDEADLERRVELAVRIFMQGYAAKAFHRGREAENG